ncbi:MAG: DUF697 domain-containing protein [Cyanobacteria bacterium J06641_5]
MRKPLLIGGVGLSFGLWAWSSVEQSLALAQVGEYASLGLMVAGGGVWWWQRRQAAKEAPVIVAHAPLKHADLDTAVAAAEAAIARLEAEDGTLPAGRERLAALTTTLQRQDLTVTAIGRSGTGKTSLLAQLDWSAEPLLAAGTTSIKELALDNEFDAGEVTSDLILFAIDGDLGEVEFQALQQLHAARHQLLLVLNKCDRYLPEELATLTQTLQQRVEGFLAAENVPIAIAAVPGPLKVRRELADGTTEETIQERHPETTALTNRLATVLTAREDLLLAAAWRQATAIAREARQALNAMRCDRALPIIDRYQWISAAAAFANPVGTLDLLATSAVSAQLALDLGEIYQQKLSLQQAQAIVGALGKQMVQLGIVELSTQTVGGLLKSHALTYVAGGAIQGVSAAYLTRLAGLSLVESFAAMPAGGDRQLNLSTLQQKLKAVFALTKRTDIFESLFAQARTRLPLAPSNINQIDLGIGAS